jgi:hypothetical protein
MKWPWEHIYEKGYAAGVDFYTGIEDKLQVQAAEIRRLFQWIEALQEKADTLYPIRQREYAYDPEKNNLATENANLRRLLHVDPTERFLADHPEPEAESKPVKTKAPTRRKKVAKKPVRKKPRSRRKR